MKGLLTTTALGAVLMLGASEIGYTAVLQPVTSPQQGQNVLLAAHGGGGGSHGRGGGNMGRHGGYAHGYGHRGDGYGHHGYGYGHHGYGYGGRGYGYGGYGYGGPGWGYGPDVVVTPDVVVPNVGACVGPFCLTVP